MKPVTVAAALEAGKVKPNTVFSTDGGHMRIGPNTINDSHAIGTVTVEQIIQKSSNVGTAKIALMLDREYHWNFLRSAGFGEPPYTGFPGEVSGRLRGWKNWVPVDQATISYGHGISVQSDADGAVLSDVCHGWRNAPGDVYPLGCAAAGKEGDQHGNGSFGAQMLEMVTLPGGTATKAQVIGYRVAGKTGTATQAGKRHVREEVCCFVCRIRAGFRSPADCRGDIDIFGTYYGGQVATPRLSSVVAGSLRMLGVPPDFRQPAIQSARPGCTGSEGGEHEARQLTLPQIGLSAIDQLATGRRVIADSRQIQPGDVFLAFRGEYADGRKYIADAVEAGAAAVSGRSRVFAGMIPGRCRMPLCRSCARRPASWPRI